ncbi:MAG: DNA (cytosine-5-)-methyltransferase [Chloroflexota bacterium]|nr:DNA (cytosine-5-)-methyltransferase [Chloroflexota bacterium]
MIRYIDLFAGIGGMRIGFDQAGAHCVFSSEWDKFCQQTYAANHGDRPFGDITHIPSHTIPDHDILLAGFPCQPFSIAGVSKKNSLGREHGFQDRTQGNLFFEIARILSAKRPAAFLLENVKNLQTHDRGRTFQIITDTLDQLGYHIVYKVIDAAHYVPQHRERVFIVGLRKDRFESNDFVFPPLPTRSLQFQDILESEVEPYYTLSDHLWTYLKDYAEKHRRKGNGFGYGLVDPTKNEVTRTLSARYHKDGSEILIQQLGRNPRRLTPRECARLMGFADDFKIQVSRTQAYRQFGNAVAVPVVVPIAQTLVNLLRQTNTANPSDFCTEVAIYRTSQIGLRIDLCLLNYTYDEISRF